MTSDLLTPEAAARYLGGDVPLSKSTLSGWRAAGAGPAFVRVGGARRGSIRYRRGDLDAWLQSQTRTPQRAA
jgi:hypothetical protein